MLSNCDLVSNVSPLLIFCRYQMKCKSVSNVSPRYNLQHEAETRLQTMVGHFSIDPSRIKTHVRFGSVRDVVNEMGEELDADVVVIGSRNPSITTHLLGSNASSVVRHATLPVLVVR